MSKTASIILSIFLTALIVGGGTYYLTNQTTPTDKDELESQVGELQTQVEQLQNENQELSLEQTQKDTNSEKSVETPKTVYQEVQTYCKSRADLENNEVAGMVFVENNNGYFVECKIATGPTGFASIGKKINGEWKKLWEGNGEIRQSIVDNNDIPYSIHQGNTAPDENF